MYCKYSLPIMEEALELNKKASQDQKIPLYNIEGEIIGEFLLGACDENRINDLQKELESCDQ